MSSDLGIEPGSRPCRVLHLVSTFQIKTDTKWLEQIARTLDRRRFHLSAACFYGGGPIRDRLDALGVRTWNLKVPGACDPRAVLRARRLIARGYDIVHTHLLRADLLGGAAARLAGAPVVVSTAYAIGDYRRARRRRCDPWLDAACARLPTHVLAVCGAVRDDCVGRLGIRPERITVIHTGIDISDPVDAQAGRAFRRAWGIPAGAPLILTVARLSYEKGIDVLIDAAARVHAARPQARFVIVGDGPERKCLEGRIRDRGLDGVVRLAGFRADVRSILAAGDAFCLPSKSEGMPNALLEAMAAGLPVVAAAVGGVPEVITSGRDGLLVEPRNPRALADALVSAIDDPAGRIRLGRAARRTIDERFGARDVVRRYERLYERLLDVEKRPHACALAH